MSSKSDNVAGDLVRSYNYVRRLVGVPFRDDDGLWVLSRPTFPDETFDDLVGLLTNDEAPTRRTLARAIGAKEVRSVTSGTLGKATYHLKRLGDRDRLHALVDEGVAPLRSFRDRDIDGLIDEAAAAVATLSALVDREPPEDPLRFDGDLNDRIATLFDDETAAYVADARQAPRLGQEAYVEQVRRAISDFVATARAVHDNQEPSRPEVRDLWKTLRELPTDRSRRRVLLETFTDWLPRQDYAHGFLPQMDLTRCITWDLVETAKNLADVALEHAAEVEQRPVPPEVDHAVIATALRLREFRPTMPLSHQRWKYEGLHTIAKEVDPAMVAEVWPALLDVEFPALGGMPQMLETEMAPRLMRRAIENRVEHHAVQFSDSVRFEAYLDAVEKLHEHPVPNLYHGAHWFVRLFAENRSVPPALVLAVVGEKQDSPRSVISTLNELDAAGLADVDGPILAAVRDWSNTTVHDPPPEIDDVVEMLGAPRAGVEKYLHRRRFVGRGETFSDNLVAPLLLEEKEERELEALTTLVEQASGERRESLEARIEALSDPERRAGRLDAAVRRARNTFERAMEDLERESLDACLDRMTADAFQYVMGRRLAPDRIRRMRPIVMLATADRIDTDLLRSFLDDLVEERPLAERPENVAWLQRMRSRMDVDRWLEGFRGSVEIDGEAIEFRTEDDPLHALRMGSYFKTCLSLEAGFNSAATLTNAIDVNKQVVYGRRADGSVVARKLIGVTDDAELIGYRTYAFEHGGRTGATLNAMLMEFARECGLGLTGDGEPRNLHGGFWYDDGAERWSPVDAETPDDIPGDEYARYEWSYVSGFEEPSSWVWVANTWEHGWADGAYAQLWIHHPDLAAEVKEYHHDVVVELPRRGCVAHIGRIPGVHPWGTLARACESLPRSADVVRALIRQVRRCRENVEPDGICDELIPIPEAFTTVPVGESVGFIEKFVRLARSADVECVRGPHSSSHKQHESCRRTFVSESANVLHAAWELHGADDDAVDDLLASDDALVRALAIELLTRVQAPGAGRRLRSLAREHGPDGTIEFAVARQGTDADRWLLTQLAEKTDAESVAQALEKIGADAPTAPPATDDEDPAPLTWEEHRLRLRPELVGLLGDDPATWRGYIESLVGDAAADTHASVFRAAGSTLAPGEFESLCTEVARSCEWTETTLVMVLGGQHEWDIAPYRFQRILLEAVWPTLTEKTRGRVVAAMEKTPRAGWFRDLLDEAG